MQDSSSKQNRIDLNNLLLDPKLWENVLSFHINDYDEIKIVYLQKCIFQPLGHNFPKKEISGIFYRFNPELYVFALGFFLCEVNIFKFYFY